MLTTMFHVRRVGEHNVPCKVSCDNCRSSLFDEGRNTVLVYPSSIQFKDNKIPKDFMPTAHIFYGERCVLITYSSITNQLIYGP
jgi:hypothetical protein